MKIYAKILLTTLPLVLLSLLAAAGITYYLAFNALTELAENWLETRLSEAVDVATEHEEVLHAYGLQNVDASVKQAQSDAGIALLTIEIGDLGHIFVADSGGNIIIHPDQELVGTDVSSEDWFQAVSNNQQGQLAYAWQGVNHFAVYDYFEPWEWYIFATDPQSEVYGAINQMGVYVLILGVVGSVIMALALMFLTRRLTAPLGILVAGAEQVGQGNLETHFAVNTSDEIGLLAGAFNNMTDQLRVLYARLQERLQTVVSNAPIILFALDNKGVFTLLEGKGLAALELESGEVVGQSVFDVYADVPQLQEDIRRVLAGETLNSIIEMQELFFETWYSPHQGQNGAETGVIGVASDITERKRAEEKLRQQNEYLAALHETTLGLISRLNLNELLEALVARAGQLLGTPHGYVYLMEPFITDADKFDEAELERKVGLGVYGESIGFRLKSGEGLAGKVWQTSQPLVVNNYDTWSGRSPNVSYDVVVRALMGVPLKSSSQIMGVIGMGYDVNSDRTFGDEEVELLSRFAQLASIALDNARLYTEAHDARTAAEITAQELSQALDHLKTTQDQLVETEKMAALGGLVAGVAHEINTPVGVGVTAASALEDKTVAFLDTYKSGQMKRSDLEKYLNMAGQSSSMILRNLSRAAELIQSFKQVAVDQSTEERRTFTVKPYLEEVLLSLQPQLKKTKHTIEIKGSDEITLESYPGVFSQIVTNLVMNSLLHAYEPDDKGHLTFELKRKNSHFIFEYADDGKGISEENLSKIFDPFFTTKRGQGGSGLGLHIIYNLVTQRLGGTIRCESEVGAGTRFVIELPFSPKNT